MARDGRLITSPRYQAADVESARDAGVKQFASRSGKVLLNLANVIKNVPFLLDSRHLFQPIGVAF